jgi:hypothetical protein
MPDTENKEIKKLSVQEQHEHEMRELDKKIKEAQLEELNLSKEEKKYSLQDLRNRLGERELKEIQRKNDREAQGRTFQQQAATDQAKWKVCTHKKGGIVSQRDMRALSTGGNGGQYAVIKHQMINGDIWVRCLRCAKTWTPPVKSKFYFDKTGKQVPTHLGEFDAAKYAESVRDYQKAIAFETNNTMSGSVQVKFQRLNAETGELVDASNDYRDFLKDTTLR